MKIGHDFSSDGIKKPSYIIHLTAIGLLLIAALIVTEIWEYYDNRKHLSINARLEANRDAEYLRDTILKLILSSEDGGAVIHSYVDALNTRHENYVRLIHSEAVDAQYGVEANEFPVNEEEKLSLIDGEPRDWETEDYFISLSVFKAIRECQACHHLPGKPNEQIPVGYAIALLEVTQPKTELKHAQSRLLQHTVRGVGLTIFVVLIFVYGIYRLTVVLRESEQRTTAIIKTVGEGIIVIGQDSHIRFLNHEVCAIFGYLEEELLGKNIEMLVPAKYKKRHMEGMKRYLETGETNIMGRRIELEGVRKDGTVFPIELRLEEAIIGGRSRFITAAIRDVTHRMEVEKAYRKSEEKYRGLIESAGDAIFVVDIETGIITETNKKAEELLGLTREEIIGMHQSRLHPKNKAEHHTRNFRENMRNEKEFVEDIILAHKDGHDIPVEIRTSIIELEGGKKIVLGIFRDVTERKEAQRALEHFSRKLVESQENERKRIAAELHDSLGQNLLAIRNGIKQYLSSFPTGKEHSKDLDQIADLAIESINELREISLNLHPHELDHLGLKTAIESMIERATQSSGISVSSDIFDIDGQFPKDIEINIYRIIQESLNNVVKYSGAKKAEVSLKKIGKHVKIKIADQGKGFDTLLEGPGFGLKSINERVKMMHGSFEIDSAPGKGAEIKILVPVKED